MKIINVAIFGLGKVGLGYDLEDLNGVKSHTKAVLNNPNFNLVFGVDQSLECQKQFIEFTKKEVFSNIAAVPKLLRDQIQLVIIATPTQTRVNDCTQILNALENIEYVILEKPICLTMKDSDVLESLFKKKGLEGKVFVNYMRRCLKNYITLRDRIRLKEFGDVENIKLIYSSALLNMGSHFIDLLLFLLDLKFTTISKTGHVDLKNGDFTASAIMASTSSPVRLELVFSPDPVYEIEIQFSNNKVQIIESGKKIITSTKIENVDLSFYQAVALEHIYNVISQNGNFLSNFDTAKKTLELCEDIRNF